MTTAFFADLREQVPEYVDGSLAAAVLGPIKKRGGRPRATRPLPLVRILTNPLPAPRARQADPAVSGALRRAGKEAACKA